MKYIVFYIGAFICFIINLIINFIGMVFYIIWNLKLIGYRRYLAINLHDTLKKEEILQSSYLKIFKRWFKMDYFYNPSPDMGPL